MPRVVLSWPYRPAEADAPARPVPNVSGRPVREAALALHRRGFRVTLRGLGRVTRTLPAAGETATPGPRSSCGPTSDDSMPLTWTAAVDELRRADLLTSAPPKGADPTGIGVDSRTISRGMLYVAVRGSQADGHRFVADAVGRGAGAVVVEAPQQSGVPEIVVREGQQAAVVLGSAWYGHPGRCLTLIGVTGTNGKTTTTGLIRHLFNQRETAGSIGTLGAFDGLGQAIASTAGSLTTPGPIDLQATLGAMVERGRHSRGHGSVLPQPRPAAARRAHLRGRRLHQPHPRPSRLSRHDGGVPRGEAASERAAGAQRPRGHKPG